jgi:hypothetical protein
MSRGAAPSIQDGPGYFGEDRKELLGQSVGRRVARDRRQLTLRALSGIEKRMAVDIVVSPSTAAVNSAYVPARSTANRQISIVECRD